MNIRKTMEGNKLAVALEGRLDTTTAPALEEELRGALTGIQEIDFDFSALEYISSAGLRVLLSVQKKLAGDGRVVIRNANELVMEVFEVTGFVDILTIE